MLAAARENKGVLQSLGYDRYLISWNLLPKCYMHVSRALSTAIAIRDQYAALDMARGALTMGVWTGPLWCGSVGTADLKSFSVVGDGLAQVVPTPRSAFACRFPSFSLVLPILHAFRVRRANM